MPPKINGLTALLWGLVNVIGFGLAGAGFHNFPLAFTLPPDVARLGSFRAEAAIVGFFFGFIPALLIGFLQRWILRRYYALSRWWILSVSSGVGVLHFLSDGFENARDLSFAVFLSGLLVGIIQWRLLRPHTPAVAGWWFGASLLGWCVGWGIGIAILHSTGLLYRAWMPGLDGQTHGVLGLAIGATFSVSTGGLLGYLPAREAPAPPPST